MLYVFITINRSDVFKCKKFKPLKFKSKHDLFWNALIQQVVIVLNTPTRPQYPASWVLRLGNKKSMVKWKGGGGVRTRGTQPPVQ